MTKVNKHLARTEKPINEPHHKLKKGTKLWNFNFLNENFELKAMTKQPQACPSLTPASTLPCWQVIWFSLATICACLHLKKNQQTEELAHVKYST